MLPRSAAAVSPTALYTGAVWARHGLSHPGFSTLAGTAMWAALRPPHLALGLVGGPSLDALLLARHHTIDTLLRREIDAGRVGQVIEIAGGLSPRGWRFAREYGDRLTYVEADLPAMAARKAEVLRRNGLDSDHHTVTTIDAFADAGPESLAALASDLDPAVGTAVITEGLINYFPLESVLGLWPRIAAVLRRTGGIYLSDLHLDIHHDPLTLAAGAGLSVFVRGRVYLHFGSEDEALASLVGSGFNEAELLRPSDFTDDSARARRRGVDRNLIVAARVERA